MKKKVLVERVHERCDRIPSKKRAHKMVNFLLQKMKEAIYSGEGLKVSGFGSFRRKNNRVLFRPSKILLNRLKMEAKRSKM